AIIAVDEDQRITIFNHAAESLFGYSAEEVIGRPVELLVPPRAAAEHRGWMQRFGREPPVPRRMGMGGATGRRKNGQEFPLEASISKFVVRGRLTYLAILRDVTQQRALE